jgi:hypothetical protein
MQGKCKLYNSKYKKYICSDEMLFLQNKKTNMTGMILVSDLWSSVLFIRR